MILFLALLPALVAFIWIGYKWRGVTRTRDDDVIGQYLTYTIAGVCVLMYVLGGVTAYCIGLMYA